MDIRLQNIESNFNGFSGMLDVCERIRLCGPDEELAIIFPQWFDANMCAVLGAILHLSNKKKDQISFKWISLEVKKIMQKNSFLFILDFDNFIMPDLNGTTIEYRQFSQGDYRSFSEYVERNFREHGLPEMSEALLKEFRKSIFEIFENAVTHSETEYIFACGQYFPYKKRLDFSIADVGIGFYRNVTSKTKLDLSPVQAIEWAMGEEKTTKSGPIPGGLGLKLILEFVTQNKGKMQIASDSGFWELSEGRVRTRTFSSKFPGTVVNIEINTADSRSYCLEEEIKAEDIL